MKYPQLVSDRAVRTISDWLVTRLEELGVEAPIVYSRLLLSLLHTPLQVDSVDLADIPQLKNWLGKRFNNSRRLTQSDAERLKRVAAIESLMEVVEANEKRAHIVELVSELCGKLKDLERSEGEQQQQLQQQEQSQVVVERERKKSETMSGKGTVASVTATAAAAATAGGGAGSRRSGGNKSNPYYQMFPALSGGNCPGSGSSSRTTSISGGGESSANWGRGDCQQGQPNGKVKVDGGGGQQQQREQKHVERMSNGSMQDLFSGAAGGGGGDKGTNKRKNKKRRTNNAPPATTTATTVSTDKRVQQNQQQSLDGGRKRQQQQQHPKKIEWDTNFSGQWEMEEQDPIKEFLNAQRKTTTNTTTSDNDCESVTTTTTDDAGYDNVFKMKRSDVNEEQTMLIKSFLTKQMDPQILPTATNEMPPQAAHSHPPHHPPVAFGFGFEAAEEFLSLSAEENNTGARRRLFEREVSAESLVVMSGMNSLAGEQQQQCYTLEEPTTEFDAKLDAFKAKFDTNIRNLWSEEGQGEEGDEEEENYTQQQQPPMSVNSFWQNYNKHLYEFQDNASLMNSLETSQNFNAGGGGWPMDMMGQHQQEAPNMFKSNSKPPSMAIWSNNDYEEAATAAASSQICLQQYNERMAAAYQKQMAFGAATDDVDHQLHPVDLFGATMGAGGWSNESCNSMGGGAGGGMDAMMMNNGELEQLYYSTGFVADYNVGAEREVVDDNNNNNNRGGGAGGGPEANLQLEQSIAMINHSSTSSFAKVDRQVMMMMGGCGGGSSSNSRAGGGGQSARGGGSSLSSSASSSSVAITNMSSLYGSFKQNSTENLLTSERTHFRPIKQAYLDGHTFDIACSPDTIEYVRSKSGSLFFELDKYMEYTVEEPSQDGYDERQQTTNVPITRCGAIVSDSEAEEEEKGEDCEMERTTTTAEQVKNEFTLKFCVRQQNEKCCQTEVIDYERMSRNETMMMMMMVGNGRNSNSSSAMEKYPKNVLPNVSTLDGGVMDLEAVAYELLEDNNNSIKWNSSGGCSSAVGSLSHHNMSMLWENSGGENSLDSSLNYESLPANRLLRDELSADAEEILKDSLTYMQNLYIDDMEEEEGQGGGEQERQFEMARNNNNINLNNNNNNNHSEMDLANYYEMGQLISEILNPGTVKKIAQVLGGGGGMESESKSEDILWYKNWPQKSWLMPMLDQSAVVASLCKAGGTTNVWHYGGSQMGHNQQMGVVNNSNGNNKYNDSFSVGREGAYEGERGVGEREEEGQQDWKFSNLRMLWNDTQLILNEDQSQQQQHQLQYQPNVIPEENEDEEGDDLLNDLNDPDDDDYHLIIFEKKDPVSLPVKGRKRRHSASQNLYDEDLELFNGDDVKWFDYCCKCDCGKRSEKILKYRNKLLMKRVDQLGYVHNASLLWKNFSQQFDSIDEILNEGLICRALAAGGGGLGELCEYEGEYCGGAGGGGGAAVAEKLCLNMDQVSVLNNPNMYLNRTALISMARPLTR